MRRMAAVIWMTALVTGTCDDGGSQSGTENTNTSTPGSPVVVQAAATSFQPADTTVTAGTTVRWVNNSGVAHTVTSGTGSSSADAGTMFDQPLANGQTFEFTFSTAGTYAYFCRPHEAMNMRGTVTVTAGGGSGGSGGGSGGGGGGDGSGGGGGYTYGR